MTAFMEGAQLWANTVLMWIGFGTVVGLLAKALMPGKDQGGAVATMLMGIGGSVVGLGLLALFFHGHKTSPTSLVGFLAAIVGSFVLLSAHRLLQGSFFRELGTGPLTPKRRRRASVVVHED
jgi:uncharacterized membrane protein YeaQ/YmgE (transglycosylase-associated protein family)